MKFHEDVDSTDTAFMVIIFDGEIMQGVHGVVRYRDKFDAAME